MTSTHPEPSPAHPRPGQEGHLPLVSVVIPCRNGELTLPSCLDALNQQTLAAADFEVIVADGRSTDATATIAQKKQAQVVDNPGRGAAAGRNAGIAHARAKYVAFLDDDCIPPPDWLANALREIEHSSAGAVGGALRCPPGSSSWSEAIDIIFGLSTRAAKSVQGRRIEVQTTQPMAVLDIPGGNCILRREAALAVGPYDEDLWAEDVDLHLRLRQAGYVLQHAPSMVCDHAHKASVQSFFRQARRYAIGRVQVSAKHQVPLAPAHHLVAWLGILSAILLVLGIVLMPQLTLTLLLSGALISGALAGLVRRRMAVTVLFPVAAATFIAGWTLGYVQQWASPQVRKSGW